MLEHAKWCGFIFGKGHFSISDPLLTPSPPPPSFPIPTQVTMGILINDNPYQHLLMRSLSHKDIKQKTGCDVVVKGRSSLPHLSKLGTRTQVKRGSCSLAVWPSFGPFGARLEPIRSPSQSIKATYSLSYTIPHSKALPHSQFLLRMFMHFWLVLTVLGGVQGVKVAHSSHKIG